jgi:hypothetical protein
VEPLAKAGLMIVALAVVAGGLRIAYEVASRSFHDQLASFEEGFEQNKAAVLAQALQVSAPLLGTGQSLSPAPAPAPAQVPPPVTALVQAQAAPATAQAPAPAPEKPAEPAHLVRVSAPSAILRSGPGVGFRKVGFAPSAYELTVKGARNHWYEVQTHEGTAWIRGDLVKPIGKFALGDDQP